MTSRMSLSQQHLSEPEEALSNLGRGDLLCRLKPVPPEVRSPSSPFQFPLQFPYWSLELQFLGNTGGATFFRGGSPPQFVPKHLRGCGGSGRIGGVGGSTITGSGTSGVGGISIPAEWACGAKPPIAAKKPTAVKNLRIFRFFLFISVLPQRLSWLFIQHTLEVRAIHVGRPEPPFPVWTRLDWFLYP